MNVRRLVPLACALQIGLFATLLNAQRGAAPPAPARMPQPVAREMAAEYRQFVEQFRHGDAESAVNVIRTWQIASVEAVQDVQPWDRLILRAAAMLETDAALSSSPTRSNPSTRAVSAGAGRSRWAGCCCGRVYAVRAPEPDLVDRD